MSPDDRLALRTRSGLSTYDVARRAGLNELIIKRFELGRVAPRLGALVALRRAFGEIERDLGRGP